MVSSSDLPVLADQLCHAGAHNRAMHGTQRCSYHTNTRRLHSHALHGMHLNYSNFNAWHAPQYSDFTTPMFCMACISFVATSVHGMHHSIAISLLPCSAWHASLFRQAPSLFS